MFKKRRNTANLRKREDDDAGDAAGGADDQHEMGAEIASAVARRQQARAARAEVGVTAHSTSTGTAALDKIGAAFAKDLEERKQAREDAEDPNFGERIKGAKGPKPPSKSIKTYTVTDTKSHICKPYYQNGWCKYGDSCKYAHIREDYMNSADLDREYERRQAQAAGGGDSDSDSSDEGAGLTCPICGNQYVEPVVTRYCRHVFCADCAMDHDQASNQQCYVCRRGTDGVFNEAHAIKRLLAAQQEQGEKVEGVPGESGYESDEEVETPAAKRRRLAAGGWSMRGRMHR